MTTPAPEPAPDLVRAAQDLENEIRQCEETLVEASKVRLNSEKNLGRAARALQKANEHRDQTAARATALMGAIQAAHGRAEAVTSRMAARAAELQTRLQQFQDLQARVGTIAEAVREVTEFTKGAKTPGEILERLTPVETRVEGELKEARAQEFDDIAHEIAGLREMLAAVRRRLGG